MNFPIKSKKYNWDRNIWKYEVYNTILDESVLYVPKNKDNTILDKNTIYPLYCEQLNTSTKHNAIKLIVSTKNTKNPNFNIGELIVTNNGNEIGKVLGNFIENSVWNYTIRFVKIMENNIKYVVIDTMSENEISKYYKNKE